MSTRMSARIFLIACVQLFFVGYVGPGLAGVQDWKSNRVSQLEKITVGPWNNFAASISPDDQLIYFTRDNHQISNIYYQNTETTRVNRLIGERGDAKQAVVNQKGSLLAMTFYGNDAQGDICLLSIEESTLKKNQEDIDHNSNHRDINAEKKSALIDCITSVETVDQTPFWIDSNTLGYLRRFSGNLSWELVEVNLTSKQTLVLSNGYISAPSASPDGRYILFNQFVNRDPKVQVYDRVDKTIRSLQPFDVSGVSGFFAFSSDGEMVYFNHYLNDTNADQKIDGSDNSVIFRVPRQTWFSATKPIFPEQLTSVDNNCKFPALSAHYLYVTCAFEGSLDIYRLSLNGVVPTTWDEAKIWEAHRAARSYEQRLLLLNTLRYRFGKHDREKLERILSNHLEIGELSAASFYISELIQRMKITNDRAMLEFYRALAELVTVRASKQRVPVNVVTTRFQQVVVNAREKFKRISADSNLLTLMSAQMDHELENDDTALKKLKTIEFGAKLFPLQRYLIFELYKQLLGGEKTKQLLAIYPLMFNEKSLTAESRLYYAFSYLKLMSRINLPVQQRLMIISQALGNSEFSQLKTLFQAELLSLELSAVGKSDGDKKTQRKTFKKLRKLLGQNRKDQLLRKAMHTRAILNLGQANQFKYMELLSSHWLAVTHISELEFVNVAEQYSTITMNKAYGVMSRSDTAKAYVIFYSAIRQTNDLEAHYQFVTLGLTPSLKKKENLAQSYAQLKKEKLIGQNKYYVNALQRVIQAERSEKNKLTAYDEALELLSTMNSSGFNPAMRDLLMAYLYHQKLRISQKGYAYDKSLFQRAHYHYMMALDLARDNARITATVWQNLGWLQFEVRQYGLAAEFFRLRLTLPFVEVMGEISSRWMLARSTFYNNQKDEAVRQSEKIISLARANNIENEAAFIEKAAFYATQAENYPKAIQYYELLFKQYRLSKTNQAKAILAHAYALMETRQNKLAMEQFKKLIKISQTLKVLPKSNQRLVALYPQRYQLLAYGFLAKLSQRTEEKLRYRQQRITIFKKMKGKAMEFAYDEAGRLSFMVKDMLQSAVDHEKNNEEDAMARAIHEALLTAEFWMDETADDVGPVIYRALMNYLTLNISHPESFTGSQNKDRDRIVKRVMTAFRDHPYRSNLVVFQDTKLKILWSAMRLLLGQIPKQARELDILLGNDEIRQLKRESPESVETLEFMVAHFQNFPH